jgi:hypothetical protein
MPSPQNWIAAENASETISLPDALIGCVRIMLGISAHDPSIGCRAASRELLHAEARRRVSRKTST